MSYKGLCILVAVVMLALLSSASLAGYQDLIGYPELEDALGTSVPTGAGVAVTQAEAKELNDEEPPEYTDYMPDVNHSEFSGKTFDNVTGTSLDDSTHATRVGQNFYGNSTSIAPGISNITNFYAGDWIYSGFLRTGSSPNRAPYTSTSRIANHSWVGDAGSSSDNSDVLRRVDFVVETDDYIQIMGVNNGSTKRPLLADSYNAIAVGVTNGNHAKGTTSVDSVYVSGRTKPDLVAPGYEPNNSTTATSWATPMVAVSAALLVETGQSNPGLSNGSYTSPRTTATIYHAETSEVVKAALMAGADRNTNNWRGANISDYTVDTNNGLDSRFGAGQVNIFNSYNIISDGEYDSTEDGGPASIGQYGFDYDSAFGGGSGSNSVASYYFDVDANTDWLMASLAWNLDIAGGTGIFFNDSATFYDLDLLLYDLSSGSALVGVSDSLNDSTENLYQSLDVGHSYKLVVSPKAGQGDFVWDYGLAWSILSKPLPGDANGDGLVSAEDFASVQANFGDSGAAGIPGDANLDGMVSAGDFASVQANFGNHLPEPATLGLLVIGSLVLLGRRSL